MSSVHAPSDGQCSEDEYIEEEVILLLDFPDTVAELIVPNAPISMAGTNDRLLFHVGQDPYLGSISNEMLGTALLFDKSDVLKQEEDIQEYDTSEVQLVGSSNCSMYFRKARLKVTAPISSGGYTNTQQPEIADN